MGDLEQPRLFGDRECFEWTAVTLLITRHEIPVHPFIPREDRVEDPLFRVRSAPGVDSRRLGSSHTLPISVSMNTTGDKCGGVLGAWAGERSGHSHGVVTSTNAGPRLSISGVATASHLL